MDDPKPKRTQLIEWKIYNQNQTKEKTKFLQLLNVLVNSAKIQEKPYLFGRPSTLISDIVKCCAIKVYTNQSCRKVVPDLEYAYELGIITKIPHYNILNSYMREKWFPEIIKELIELSALPFADSNTKFGIDSTGFGKNTYERWNDIRGTRHSRKGYLKLHLICSTDSLVVPSVEVTEGKVSDYTMFKPLVEKTSRNFDISQVYADKGYSSKENYELVKRKGGQAFIPFKSNTSGKSRGSYEWVRAYNLWKNDPETFNKFYHRRSTNESVFSSVKRTKLNFIRSRNFNAGKSEIMLKVLCHNLVILAKERGL